MKEQTLARGVITPAYDWEKESATYDRMHIRLGIILQQVVSLRPSSVLELGCGIGVLRKELKRRLGTSFGYYGCDISTEAVRAINDPYVLQHDVNDPCLPFGDSRFDCVVGSGIIEYIENVPRFLTAVSGRLVSGGHLIISYFNMAHFYRRTLRGFGRRPYCHPAWQNNYSLRAFEGALRDAHLRVMARLPVSVGLLPPPKATAQIHSHGRLRVAVHKVVPRLFVHTMIYCCAKRSVSSAQSAMG